VLVPAEVRTKIQAAAADMSAAIATAIHAELPQAELVHDKFHVSKLLGQAVDKVRQFFLRAYLCFVTSA